MISNIQHEGILEYLKSSFITTDNFQRNYNYENTIVMKEKASFLLTSAIGTGRFAPLFRKIHVNYDGLWEFDLPEPVVLNTENTHGQDVRYNKFCVDAGPMKNYQNVNGSSRFSLIVDPSNLNKRKYTNPTKDNIFLKDGKQASRRYCDHHSMELFERKSMFDVFRPSMIYGSPEKICRFFGNSQTSYGAFKPASNAFKIHHFYDHASNEYLSANDSSQYCDVVNEALFDFVVENQRWFSLNNALERYEGLHWQQVYSFKNEHDEVVQKAIRLYAWEDKGKCLFPCTCWMQHYSTQYPQHCIPLPGKQILYNLNLLKGNQTKTVILTDSVEIAEMNQQHSPKGVVWTSFLPEDYTMVDWSPLEENDLTVYLLVTNHSNMNLAEKYVSLYDLADYLDDNFSINLKFIQLKVEYPESSKRIFQKVSDLVINSEEPKIIDASIVAMDSFSEFEKFHQKALRILKPVNVESFWQQELPYKENSNGETNKIDAFTKREASPFLLRPVIKRGEVTIFRSWRGLGKSSLLYSICHSVISQTDPIKDKWWTVPKSNDGFRKVLYLDFESGKNEINKKLAEIIAPQLKNISNPKKRQECEKNFIIEDLRGKGMNCTEQHVQTKLLDLIERATYKGIERPVDLVVFDTYSAAIGSEDKNSWEKFSELIDKILAKGMAVVIVHQSTQDGNGRGFKIKEDAYYKEIVLERKNNETGTLEDAFWVKSVKNRGDLARVDCAPFQIHFKDGKWRIFESEMDSIEEFGEIVKAYKDNRFYRDAICQMLGISKSTYHDKLNEYKEKHSRKKKN